MHEAQTTEEDYGPGTSKFITLTYSPENLPKDESLSLKEFQKFLKRYRKSTKNSVRFFGCGEYGGKLTRPHYHLILFNADLGETKQVGRNKAGHPLYSSEMIAKSWPFGYNWVGELTFQSAAYTARYILKKINGKDSITHYNHIDEQTGEIYSSKLPEFVTMSRRPGIGKEFYNRYKNDIYPRDQVVIDNKKYPVPAFYDKLLAQDDPKLLEELKVKREKAAVAASLLETEDRLRQREQFKHKQVERLIRGIHE